MVGSEKSSDWFDNYTCQNDKVLKTPYKVGAFFMSKPIGIQLIDVAGVENVDISNCAQGHMDCKIEGNKDLAEEQQ